VVFGRIGPDGVKALASEGAKLWARFGYTTAEEGRAIPQMADVMKQVAAEGGFVIDVNTYVDVLVDRAYIKANQSSTYTNRFRVAGAKLTIDGSPQGFTAWRDRPYYKPVGNRRDSPRQRTSAPCSSTASSCARTNWTATRRSGSFPRCSRCTPSTGGTGTSITPSAPRPA
jgi:predicted amidohydrolase YtcJ